MAKNRINNVGHNKTLYMKNKRHILATEDTCAICGGRVDMALKFPDPMSPSVDHIIPIARGGHPTNIDNLQLTHLSCNQTKGKNIQIPISELTKFYKNKLFREIDEENEEGLPQHYDITKHRAI